MPGETVTWKADGAYPHNVHLDGEPTALGPVSTKFSASRTFTEEGTFGYHCDMHATMHGVVYVNQSGTVRRLRPRRRPHRLRPPGARRPPLPPRPAGAGPPPLSSFRAKASVRRRNVFLTLTVGGDKALRVRGTLKRGNKRVPRVGLLARPGRHKLRLPGKRLKPGRYTLTLTVGDVRRVVHFRVRRA
jgi:hypothetical protein